MRLLMVFHASPYPRELGPARRHFHLLTEMSSRHQVSVVSYGTLEQERAFRARFQASCDDIEFVRDDRARWMKGAHKAWLTLRGCTDFLPVHNAELQRAVDRMVQLHDFDLIVLSCALLGGLRLPDVPIVGDEHNIEFDLIRRMASTTPIRWRKLYYGLQWRHTQRAELRAIRCFAGVMVTSARDREVLREHVSVDRVHVIPNALDDAAFVSTRRPCALNTLVFTGLLSYYPNEEGILWFVDTILPLIVQRVPEVTLRIVGATPPRSVLKRQSGHISVTGFVPDIRHHLEDAQVVVVPIKSGGGTRVKVLEAMAQRRAVVSTSIGVEGLGIVNEQTALVADSVAAFVNGVVRLLRDQSLCSRVAAAGQEHVLRHFHWNQVGAALDGALMRYPRPSMRRAHAPSATLIAPRVD